MSIERIDPEQITTYLEHLLYLKSLFMYRWCRQFMAPTTRCVDLGCGEGYGTQVLARSSQNVIGIDIDRDNIDRAMKRYGRNGCSFTAYDGSRLPFQDNSVDFVVSVHVIEHIDDDDAFLREMTRVLKPGGRAVISTPNKELRLPEGMEPWNFFHVREYSQKEWGLLLKDYFEEIAFKGLNTIDEVRSFEEARIKHNINLVSFDVFNLRRKLPPRFLMYGVRLDHFLTRLLSTKRERGGSTAERDPEKLYSIVDRDIRGAQDLIAVCTK